MLYTSQYLRTHSKIREIKKLDNNIIAICTDSHGIKLLSFDDCNTIQNISHENLNTNTSAIAFSPNSEFLSFSFDSFIYILHMPSNIVIKTINTQEEKIEMLTFDLESKYIIGTTKTGRVLQYRYDGSSLLARLYSFDEQNTKNKATTVSSFAFYKNYMACGSNNGTIFTIDLHSRTNKIIFNNNNSRVNSIIFLNSTDIISADNKGNIYFNSLKNNKLIKKIETGFTKVKQIVLMPNPDFLMVVGDTNYISIYDIKKYKLLYNKYIEFDDIVKKLIVVDEFTLLASLNNNSLEKVKLPDSNELNSLIVKNSLDKAFLLVQQHTMLKDTKEYKDLEKAYENIYNQALEALINQNKNKATELTKVFKYTDSKKEEIKLLFQAFDNYARFKSLYIEKKYPLAYTMASKFPALQKTFQYAKMEEQWSQTFKNAQRQIAYGRYDNASSLLNEYATVIQKRPIIKLVLKNNHDFLEFLKAIELKDFQKVEKIAKTNELFTKVPTYTGIKDEINLALEDLQKDINNSDIKSAIKKITKLQNIDHITKELSILKNECSAIEKLHNAYEKNDFVACYEVYDKYHVLSTNELGILLQKQWSKIISKCEVFALKGNIKDIKTTLGEFINLSSRRDKIGDLFRVSFHSKIKGLLAQKKYKKAEAIIYSYIDIFGLDNEIISIMKMYENFSKTRLAITQNQNNRIDRDNWINSEIIMGN